MTAETIPALPDNPWREFIENCISGDNYFRASEYRQLLADLDAGYAAIEALAEARAYAAATPLPEAVLDSERLEWLLSRMTEAQLNDVLGGYRVIVTTRCARTAIDRALTGGDKQGEEG